MGLKDAIVRSLALRFAKGKVDGLRKAGSPMLRALDGKKSIIVTIGFVVSGLVAMISGADVGQWLDLLLRAFGWSDPEVINGAKETATQIVPLLFAIWAAGHALWKWNKQRKAGATVAEMGSPVGVVKAALAAGVIVDLHTGGPLSDIKAKASAIPARTAPVGQTVVVEQVTK